MKSRDNLAHGARAAVNHQPQPFGVVVLQFDEVVTTPQGSQLIGSIPLALFAKPSVAQRCGPQFFRQYPCASMFKSRNLPVQLLDEALGMAFCLEHLGRALE